MATSVSTESQKLNRVVDSRLRLFSGLWAIGHLVHLLNDDGRPMRNVFGILVVFAACFLLARPGSIRILGLLAGAQLGHVVWTAPLIPDHWILAAAVNLVILVALGFAALRLQVSDRDAEVFASAVPALKLILLVAYTAAAVAKYNTTFMDPITSCANFLTKTATGGLIGEGDGLGPVHVLSAIVPETLIPILLVLPFTRRLGVRIGIAFHLLLAISPLLVVGDFSFILTALFLLFASDADVDAVITRVRTRLANDPLATMLREVDRPFALSIAMCILTVAIGRFANWQFSPWVWLAVVMVLPRVLLALLRVPNQLRGPGAPFGRVSTAHLPIAVLLLAWVLLPYAGFRTTGVFTMFSNLRTEGPGTNHLFMPSYHPSDHQTDIVFPGIGSSDYFEDLIDNGQALSSFEVRRAMSDNPDLVLVGTRNGVAMTDADVSELRQPNSAVASRLWHLRRIPMTDNPPCIN